MPATEQIFLGRLLTCPWTGVPGFCEAAKSGVDSPATKGPFLPKAAGLAPVPLPGMCPPPEAGCVRLLAGGLPAPMTLLTGCAREWLLVTLVPEGHAGHGLAMA